MIRGWFASQLGTQLLSTEAAILEQLLPGLFGYHLMQVGITRQPLFDASPINHKFLMAIEADDPGSFRGSGVQLPFENDVIDVVLLHHILEFYKSPQEILREIARVSLPSGYLVIVGFNPVSLWGLWKGFAGFSGHPPWNGGFIRPGRLMDWLNLLSFKIDRVHFALNGLPVILKNRQIAPDYSGGLSRRTNWPFGAVYVIVARKQLGSMTPIKPLWKARGNMPKLTVIRPTSREIAARNRLLCSQYSHRR